MIFGFGRKQAEVEEEEEFELVLFQGALNGEQPDMKANARLVQAGLVRAKELVSDALARDAELIRLEPKGERSTVALYIDGVAYPAGRRSKQEGLAITQMLKLLAGLNVKVRDKPQAGGIKSEFDDKDYLVLVRTTPVQGGERLVVKMRNAKKGAETPEDLGFSDEIKEKIRELSSRKSGVILAAGPPLSGVTTLLVGIIRGIDGYLYTVYSIADQEGRELPQVTRFEGQPNDNEAQTVARAGRAEADVVWIDPLKDAERTKMALESADEFCIVAEMPAKNASSAIGQCVKAAGSPKLVAERLQGVFSQKLVRRLCKKCRQAYKPNSKLLTKVGLPAETKVLYRPPKPIETDRGIEEPEPCEACNSLGYEGRIALVDLIEMTDEIRKAVLEGMDAKAIKAIARKEGQPSIQKDGLRLVAEGVTSLEELQRAFQSD